MTERQRIIEMGFSILDTYQEKYDKEKNVNEKINILIEKTGVSKFLEKIIKNTNTK